MARFYSIRFRLTATFLAIILAVMIIISLFLYNTLEHYYLNNQRESLEMSGFLASDCCKSAQNERRRSRRQWEKERDVQQDPPRYPS